MIENRAALSADRLAEIDAEVGGQRTLQEVVAWGLAKVPPRVVVEVVVQDEYTHDAVVPIEGGLHLIYDTT